MIINDVAQKLYAVRQKYSERGAGEVGHIPTPDEATPISLVNAIHRAQNGDA